MEVGGLHHSWHQRVFLHCYPCCLAALACTAAAADAAAVAADAAAAVDATAVGYV